MRDLHPMIENLSNHIQDSWNENLELTEVEIPEEFALIDIDNGDEDSVYIENYVWESEKFRKDSFGSSTDEEWS